MNTLLCRTLSSIHDETKVHNIMYNKSTKSNNTGLLARNYSHRLNN